jgi:hypothetical protein
MRAFRDGHFVPRGFDVSDDLLKQSGIADNPVAGMALCDSVQKFREKEHSHCVDTRKADRANAATKFRRGVR